MVTVFDPQGNEGEIPAVNLAAFVKAGGKPSVKMQAPDGSLGYVPADRTQDAVKAGGKLLRIEEQPAKSFWSDVGSSLWEGIKSIPKSLTAPDPLADPRVSDADKWKVAEQQRVAAEAKSDQRTKDHGHTYDLGASANEMLGVNVEGEEEGAREGRPGKVVGTAAVVPVAMALSAALAKAGPAALEAAQPHLAKALEAVKEATPKQAAQVVGATSGAVAGHGALSIPGAYAGAKGAGSLVESVLGKERANAPIFSRPGTYPGAPLPATPAPELLQGNALAEGGHAPTPEPSAGLGAIPARYSPPSAPAEPVAAPEATPEPTAKTAAGETIPRTLSGESALRQVLGGQDNANLLKIARSRGINVTQEAQLKPGVADSKLIEKIVDNFSDDELSNLRDTYLENTRMGPLAFRSKIGAEANKTLSMQTYFPDVKIPSTMLRRTQTAISTAKATPEETMPEATDMLTLLKKSVAKAKQDRASQ